MPTGEFRTLLDREFAKAAVEPIVKIASPLLRELVDHGLNAFKRCEVEAGHSGRENEDLAALSLYRHSIEMADGIEVLISHSCGTAALPPLRSQFEACLSLSYIVRDAKEYVRRSLAWYCGVLHSEIAARERLNPGTPKGQEYQGLYAAQFKRAVRTASNAALAAEVDNLKKLLKTPQLAPIEKEYEGLRKKRKGRTPEWFSLFGGPADRFELAKRLDRGGEYRLVYADWSGLSHAGEFGRYISGLDGKPILEPVRRPDEIQCIAQFAALLLLRATREMIDRFRAGEPLQKWYVREIQPLLNQLGSLKVQIVPS